jgi:hypothetical protein
MQILLKAASAGCKGQRFWLGHQRSNNNTLAGA